MRSRTSSFFLASILAALASGTLQAQTVFLEVEPNNSKAQATPVDCMTAGDSFQGTHTGDLDYFLVRKCPLAPGVYRHRLVLSHPVPESIHFVIRGLPQASGTIGVEDANVQYAYTDTSGVRYLQWYGFGRSEQLYVVVSSLPQSALPYTLTLETVAVVPTHVAGTFLSGLVQLQGNGPADSMVWVHDQTPAPIPGYSNDDVGAFGTPFGLSRTYAPGSYILAVGHYGLINDQVFSIDDHSYTSSTFAMDFPDSLVRTTHPAPPPFPVDVSFSVTDGVTTTQVPAMQTDWYEIVWFRFDVQDTPTTVYCLGDGSATPCPCGNHSAPAEQAGCAHSFGTGGRLTASGAARVGADSWVLSGTQMPNASALYFQGTLRQNGGLGSPFGDGLRCAGGTVIRLGTTTNSGGASAYPAAGDVPISLQGQVSPFGGTHTYQCWYRNAASFCTPQTFNLTNAVEVTWIP